MTFLHKCIYGILSSILFLGLFLTHIPAVNVFADDGDGLQAFNLIGYECLVPTESCSAENALLIGVKDFLLAVAPFVAVLAIIWGGYQYFFSSLPGGKEDGLKAIQAAVTGYVVVLLADYVIFGLIGGSSGIISSDGINFETGGALDTLLSEIKGLLVGVASAVAVLVFIWGGYQYLFSSLPGGKQDGQKTLLNGAIGFVVIQLANVITNILDQTINAEQTDSSVELGLNSAYIASAVVSICNNILIPISSAVTVFFIVIAGYRFIFAKDQYAAGNAKQALINALIGFVITIFAVTLVQLIYLYAPALGLDPGAPT